MLPAAPQTRDPPWDRVLAATVIWAIVTAPALMIAGFVALILNGLQAGPVVGLALALPISTVAASLGSLASGMVQSPTLFKFSCTLPFLVIAAAFAFGGFIAAFTSLG